MTNVRELAESLALLGGGFSTDSHAFPGVPYFSIVVPAIVSLDRRSFHLEFGNASKTVGGP